MRNKTLLDKELVKLKDRLLYLGGRVEENFNHALSAVENRDANLAKQVIDTDREIDELEVEIEEECLKILALHQPVAKDLRFIVTVLKVNNDLERIDDHSVSIGRHALFFMNHPLFKYPFDFRQMSNLARQMLKDSLDSLVELNEEKAISVRRQDDEVDEINRSMYDEAARLMRANADQIPMLERAMGISRCFERISDLSCNIAEDVIYLISGQIVRH